MKLKAFARLKETADEWDEAKKKGEEAIKKFLALLKSKGLKISGETVKGWDPKTSTKLMKSLLPELKKLGIKPQGSDLYPDREGNFFLEIENGIDDAGQIAIEPDGEMTLLPIGNW